MLTGDHLRIHGGSEAYHALTALLRFKCLIVLLLLLVVFVAHLLVLRAVRGNTIIAEPAGLDDGRRDHHLRARG